MLIPRYIFTNDFVELKPLFEAQPHKEIQLKTGDFCGNRTSMFSISII